jgi:hypothetical protein
VFFDELVDAGDMRISRAYLVTAVATAGANRRLSVKSGFAGSLPSSGSLTISGYRGYRDNADDVEGIYTIAGSDGSTYIDIAPIGSWTGKDFTPGAIANATNYFPVWVESVHGFALRAQSEYYAPFGWLFYGKWLYCQQLFRVDKLLRTAAFRVNMEWLTTTGGTTPSVRTLTLTDNYRGNYRVHSQIVPSQGNTYGQGLSTTWTTPSGLHNGGRWFVQYLSFNASAQTLGNNRQYEG